MKGYCIIIIADNSKVAPELLPETPDEAKKFDEVSEPYTYLAMVDRSKNREKWWTQKKDHIMVFFSKDAADKACAKLKYGSPQVVREETAVRRISHWFWNVKKKDDWLYRRLVWLNYMIDKYDGCWEHGSNYFSPSGDYSK